ncbi:type II secretion system protein F [Bacteriovorax sp. BSW11_IV]|uniref:type II secretion system F family protein n=1 Tax=Bacteriovorax sp. BSW11_IV TaxID=1353529 RepID=UPI00038A15E7|nr:type II secretion system F family protein [Bacteriovorax sp. BSW11_IV]EQC46301.1 type II secretion system protein F [Bacteriovorax sp. BSW11_IV]
MRNLSILFLLFVANISFAQALRGYEGNYAKSTPREVNVILKEACERGHSENCFELGARLLPSENEKTSALGRSYVQKACKDGGIKEACEMLTGEDKVKGSDLLLWAGVILIGIATLIITRTIFDDEDQFKAQEKLDEGGESGKKVKDHGIVLKYSRPMFKRYVSPVVANMKNKKKIKEKYRRKLASAGLTDYLTTEDFYAFKLFLIIGFPVVFVAVRVFLEETWPLSYIPAIALIGFVYPDIWINGKIQRRQKEIISSMPFCVDMLALSVEAGLDFIAAMTKVVEKAKTSALTEEFEILIKEIKIGASRAEALRNLAWRCELMSISSFCATLIAADSVGASIGPILKALSKEIREKKSSEVEKAGATAATKILFPMMFLIVPAVFLVVGGPLAIELMGGQ